MVNSYILCCMKHQKCALLIKNMKNDNKFSNSKSNILLISHLSQFKNYCLSNILHPLKHSNQKNDILSVESIQSKHTLTHIYLLDMSVECCFGRT